MAGRAPTTAARITSISRHRSGVSRIHVAIDTPFAHCAGQYLNVVHASGTNIPLSIASAPQRLPELELHYKSTPGVAEARLMDEMLATADALQIDGPHGEVTVVGPLDTPLSLIAAGTGIAQACAIIEHLREVAQRAPVSLVWSVSNAQQLYCEQQFLTPPGWLRYHPVIDRPGQFNAAVQWLAGCASAPPGRTIISGSPGFVYAVADQLQRMGVAAQTIESDVFSYAPRPGAAGSAPHS